MKTVLTIAGSDSGGGAGIQADIKTITLNGAYAMSAITALTAQNTLGVFAIREVEPDFLVKQLDAVFEDIFPDAVKIGMVSSSALIDVIAERLEHFGAKNIVVDPVMVSTSGSKLIKDSALELLTKRLMPLATVVTPNIPEAEVLADMKISSVCHMTQGAEIINEQYGCAVLLKGGHSINDANDLLYDGKRLVYFTGKRINNPNTHGTGCTLSSAIATNLAKGIDLEQSVKMAKDYVSSALSAGLNLGRGSGPLMHNFNLNSVYMKEIDE